MKVKDIHLPQPRYIAALNRQLARIELGIPIQADDCTVPGMKSTSCSWGLCSDEVAAWPDAEDHLWPDQFKSQGRVAPLYRGVSQKCPLDRRATDEKDPNGCFYTCRVFSAKKGDPAVTRDLVVNLYQAKIKELT